MIAKATETPEGVRRREIKENAERNLSLCFSRFAQTEDGRQILKAWRESMRTIEPVPGKTTQEGAWHYLGALYGLHWFERQIVAGNKHLRQPDKEPTSE